ncbi:MAG: hypothetical protein OIF35_06300 [Cellvibrionaceae bacterium]|nr:hypothetical protein [Cellvibrionaceae bacterium]MCV6625104.1 hypothetical protein [Cellvibrionaceae bacterium]
MSNYAFRGLESNGLLLKGALPRQRAEQLAGAQFQFVRSPLAADYVECALLVVRIEQLSTWGIPLLRWTYPEAVWMLALADGGYLAIKAHTPSYMLPALSLMDRYNTDRGAISLVKANEGSMNSAEVSVSSGQAQLLLKLSEAIAIDKAALVGNLWTRSRAGNYYRIPWGDNKPAQLYQMQCSIDTPGLDRQVFGADILWQGEAIYFIDRPHRCAPAFAQSP